MCTLDCLVITNYSPVDIMGKCLTNDRCIVFSSTFLSHMSQIVILLGSCVCIAVIVLMDDNQIISALTLPSH